MARLNRADRGPARPGRRAWVFIAIAAFLLVDLALIALAFATTAPAVHGNLGPIPTFSSSTGPAPTSSSTPSASPVSTPSATAASTAIAAPRLLTAVSATSAWRATPGSCAGGNAVVEHSTDGGVTWKPSDLSKVAVHTVLFLSGGATSVNVAGGAGTACTPGFFGSFTTGQFWAAFPARMGEAAYIDPSTRALHLSTGTTAAPCSDPRQLVATTAGAAVVCADSLQTRSGTGSWQRVSLPGLLAATASTGAYTVAVSGAAGCAGVEIETVSAAPGTASAPHPVGCAASASSSGVTIAQTGGTLWLWAGDATLVSTDGGASW